MEDLRAVLGDNCSVDSYGSKKLSALKVGIPLGSVILPPPPGGGGGSEGQGFGHRPETQPAADHRSHSIVPSL